MTVRERVQAYLANLLVEGFDAFRGLVVLFGREGLDLILEGITLRDQLEYTGEVGTLLGGYLSCWSIRSGSTVSEGKDGWCAQHAEVV